MAFKERVQKLLAEKNNFAVDDADFSKLQVEVTTREEGLGYSHYEVVAYEVDGPVGLSDGRLIYVYEQLSQKEWGADVDEALSALFR